MTVFELMPELATHDAACPSLEGRGYVEGANPEISFFHSAPALPPEAEPTDDLALSPVGLHIFGSFDDTHRKAPIRNQFLGQWL